MGHPIRVAALGLSGITLLFIAAATTHTLWRRLTRTVKPEEIRITLTDTTLDPAVILLHPGSVRFAILNAGREDHTFTVQGMGVVAQVADLPPEGRGSLDVTFSKPGTYRLFGGRPGTDSPASSLTVRP